MTMLARLSLIALLLVVAATLASGCYTVIRHPSAQTLLADDHGSRRACADCHQDSRFYHDAFDPGHYGFGSYAVDPGWSDYYYRPWWYADYWYYPVPGASQPVETSQPHVWGNQQRRDMTPFPVIGGSGAVGGAGSSGSSTGTPTKPADESTKPSQRSDDEEDDEPHRAPERRDMTPKPKPPQPPPPPPN